MEKAESVPEVVESIEKLLNKHQQELLQHLDSWADRVTSAYANAPLALGSLGTLAKKPTGGTFGALNCGEAPVVSGEDAEIAPKKNRKSYDEARLTHVQAMEARSEVELSRGFSEVKPFWHSWRHFRRFCKWLVESSWANTFFALLILSNSVFLGVQLEMQAAYKDVSIQLTVFAAFNVSYAVLFSLEVALRLLACGPSSYLWLSDEYVWNWLDVFVVFASWIELIIFFLTPGSTMGTNRNFRVLRLLRFGRIVRVVRIVRVARLFRSLRTLINSLVGTLKSLFWSLLLLALIMYMFGILFTDAVLDHRNELNFADETSNLSKFFGGLYPSIVTLFRSISNGLTWGEAADALENMDNGIFWSSLFHFYVAFCSFAVLNVMTGTFCNAAIKAAERDHDMLVLSLMQTRQELREQVANLFHRIDHHGSGQITITDFESHFSDDAVIAFFESLEIGAMDAWTLFLSLDVDGDHTISVDEFTERCLQLHGPARSADIFALRQNTDKLEEELMKVEARQLQLNQRFTEVIDTHLGSLELGCVGGDALLWMVSPVLEVARRRIQQDSHERFALQAEAESLRQTVEKIAMQVEDQQCLQQRTQDRFEALLKRHEQQLEAFRSEVTALKRQRSDVEVKRRQLDTEALAAERLWKAELQQLEEERWSLEKQLENLEEQMSSLAAPRQRAQDRCVELTEKLELLQPDLQKKETLRQTNLRIEGEIEDLEREIAQLEKRKKRPSRIGMNAKQHKKSTLR